MHKIEVSMTIKLGSDFQYQWFKKMIEANVKSIKEFTESKHKENKIIYTIKNEEETLVDFSSLSNTHKYLENAEKLEKEEELKKIKKV